MAKKLTLLQVFSPIVSVESAITLKGRDEAWLQEHVHIEPCKSTRACTCEVGRGLKKIHDRLEVIDYIWAHEELPKFKPAQQSDPILQW